MQLRSDIQLKSMIKALKDVIIPAIDPANRLAVEQAQLVTGMLGLMQHQLPLQYRFDRDELGRLIDLLSRLQAVCDQDPALESLHGTCKGLITESRTVQEGSIVDPANLYDAVRRLRDGVAEVLNFANEHAAEPARKQIEQAVLRQSREQLLRDRALVAAQGWEPDPAALPSIDALLSAGEPPSSPDKG